MTKNRSIQVGFFFVRRHYHEASVKKCTKKVPVFCKVCAH